MKLTLVTDEEGEWEGLYYGDVLIDEAHRLEVRFVLESLCDLEANLIGIRSWDIDMEELGITKLPMFLHQLKDLVEKNT